MTTTATTAEKVCWFTLVNVAPATTATVTAATAPTATATLTMLAALSPGVKLIRAFHIFRCSYCKDHKKTGTRSIILGKVQDDLQS